MLSWPCLRLPQEPSTGCPPRNKIHRKIGTKHCEHTPCRPSPPPSASTAPATRPLCHIDASLRLFITDATLPAARSISPHLPCPSPSDPRRVLRLPLPRYCCRSSGQVLAYDA